MIDQCLVSVSNLTRKERHGAVASVAFAARQLWASAALRRDDVATVDRLHSFVDSFIRH